MRKRKVFEKQSQKLFMVRNIDGVGGFSLARGKFFRGEQEKLTKVWDGIQRDFKT